MMLRRTQTTGSARRPLAVLAAAVAVATIAVVPTVIGGAAVASASTLATSPQKTDMAKLMRSYNSSTGEIGNSTYTYNQGVILAGLAQLYKATKDAGLLTEAESIANAAINNLTTGGVLHEPCTGSGCRSGTGANGQSFKGIFVQDLKILVETAHTTKFNSFFATQARSIEAHDTTKAHQVGFLWSGPILDLTSYSQASGLDALVAALKLPGHA